MSNPPARLATPDFRQRLPTTNHGPAAHQTREYQSDRASRTACRTATHPAPFPVAVLPPRQRLKKSGPPRRGKTMRHTRTALEVAPIQTVHPLRPTVQERRRGADLDG